MRIIYMGTPDFAVPGLRKIHESFHRVAAVVTVPDRPKGRGLKVSQSSVKRTAIELALPVHQPVDLNDSHFVQILNRYDADCFVVVGFRILSPDIFNLPEKGTVNLHASLLPKYRGAAPIQWAIMNGETETGVTTFFIEKKVDTGKLLLQQSVQIGKDETAGELHDRLAVVGADVLVKTLNLIQTGKVNLITQKGKASYAPKITPNICEIRWDKPAGGIVNLIRGLSPYPGAYTRLNGKRLKIFRSCQDSSPYRSSIPGEIQEITDEVIVVGCQNGNIRLLEVQPEGKKRMSVSAFLRGYTVEKGMVFE